MAEAHGRGMRHIHLVGIGTGAILGIKQAGEILIIDVAPTLGLAPITALYSVAWVSGGQLAPARSFAPA